MQTVILILFVAALAIFLGAMLYFFAAPFLWGRFKDSSGRRRDRRHKPLN
ncbi:MAG: hypothetical protein KC561_01185 [Myxococcales bacterium]|nr:hypothetical protein [Myxococcales bacterium]